MNRVSEADEEIIKRIRDRMKYMKRRWKEVRDQSALDRRAAAGDPWPEKEKTARSISGQERPCLVFDELNQYTNKLICDLRLKEQAIKVDPRGNGATNQTAANRADLIRQIQYRSKAQQAYITAATGMVLGSYGFVRINKRYKDDDSDDQELIIEPIPNQDSVYIEPDFVNPDTSDIKYACVLDYIPRDDFKRKFPNAEITNFEEYEGDGFSDWIRQEMIQLGEYWEVQITTRQQLTLDETDEAGNPINIYLETIRETDPKAKILRTPDGNVLRLSTGKETKIVRQRKRESRKVVCYLTNGLEILERSDWDGKWIPIVGLFGPEEWVPDTLGSKRIFNSLVRKARDPFMAYCAARTTETELVGQIPKAPYWAYIGQLEGQEQVMQRAAKVPVAYLSAHAFTDEYPIGSGAPLPLPQRTAYEPALQAVDAYAEACRRAIQAAMGSSPLPTAAQRQNEKSALALKTIAKEESQGTYGYVEKYSDMQKHIGVILDDLIGPTYDTERVEGLRDRAGKHRLVTLNTDAPYADENGKMQHFRTDMGDHDVTISTGPSEDSQREEVSDTLDQIIGSDGLLPAAIQGNVKAAKIVGLSIRLKNGGPLMDEIANVIDPEQETGGAQQTQVELGQAKQLLQQAQVEIQKLQALANPEQTKLEIAKMQAQVELAKDAADNDTKIKVALIGAHGKIADTSVKETAIDQRQKHQAHHDAAIAVLDHSVAEIGRQDALDQQTEDRKQAAAQFQAQQQAQEAQAQQAKQQEGDQ